MTRFSDEDRRRIMSEARAHLAHRDETETPLQRAMRLPLVDQVEKWKRDHPQQEPPEECLDTPTPAIDWDEVDRRILVLVDQRIAESIISERALLLNVVAGEVGEALAAQRQDSANDLADRVRELRIELAELQTTLGELRQAVALERGRVLDLPALPRRVN
jgi:hypothetical protein